MTASTHRPEARGITPGPWTATNTAPGDPSDIYLIYGDSFVAEVSELEDAHLIAAAPDLYKALRFALPAMEGAHGEPTGRNCEVCDGINDARDALARAAGKARRPRKTLIAPQRDANSSALQPHRGRGAE